MVARRRRRDARSTAPSPPADSGPSVLTVLSRQQRLLVVGVCLVLALSLAHLWQSWRWIETYNELQAVQADYEEVRAENLRLEAEVQQAFSLERIERIATEELGMQRPEELRYLRARDPSPNETSSEER